jgi:serine protease inhibitor
VCVCVCVRVQLCSAESVRNINKNYGRLDESSIDIRLPRFKFDSQHDMSELLFQMGLCLPFTVNADFSAMVAPQGPR